MVYTNMFLVLFIYKAYIHTHARTKTTSLVSDNGYRVIEGGGCRRKDQGCMQQICWKRRSTTNFRIFVCFRLVGWHTCCCPSDLPRGFIPQQGDPYSPPRTSLYCWIKMISVGAFYNACCCFCLFCLFFSLFLLAYNKTCVCLHTLCIKCYVSSSCREWPYTANKLASTNRSIFIEKRSTQYYWKNIRVYN